MQRMRITHPFLLLLLIMFVTVSDAEPLLWGSLKPGPHLVGYRTIFEQDFSRPYRRKFDYEGKLQPGSRARLIPISVWYPAQKSAAAKTLRFEDYIYLTAREEKPGQPAEQEKAASKNQFKSRWAAQATDEQLQRLYEAQMYATQDAAPARGRFPVILIAQSVGMSYPYGNSVLAEYVASHGYVVATAPSIGPQSRQSQFDNIGVMTQLQDMQFILQQLHKLEAIDPDRLAVIGFSFGGLSTALLTMQNTDVDAYVSLDTAAANRYGYSIIFQNPLYETYRFTAPILHFTPAEASPDADNSFFKSLKYASRTTVLVKGTATEFSSLGAFAAVVPGFAGTAAESKSQQAHDAVCRYTLQFLQAQLKKDSQGARFLKQTPQQNGAGEAVASVQYHQALKAPPTEEQFMALIEQKGIDFAVKLYRDIKNNDADYNVFNPDTMNGLAGRYMENKRLKDAIRLLQLNVEAHDDAWEAHDMLGRAYAEDGNKKLAIECFERSLELNP